MLLFVLSLRISFFLSVFLFGFSIYCCCIQTLSLFRITPVGNSPYIPIMYSVTGRDSVCFGAKRKKKEERRQIRAQISSGFYLLSISILFTLLVTYYPPSYKITMLSDSAAKLKPISEFQLVIRFVPVFAWTTFCLFLPPPPPTTAVAVTGGADPATPFWERDAISVPNEISN